MTITINHSEDYPYCYLDDNEGITSANNPAFWYALGMIKPNYPVPALLQDSCSDLAMRWSNWMDTDRSFGHKY